MKKIHTKNIKSFYNQILHYSNKPFIITEVLGGIGTLDNHCDGVVLLDKDNETTSVGVFYTSFQNFNDFVTPNYLDFTCDDEPIHHFILVNPCTENKLNISNTVKQLPNTDYLHIIYTSDLLKSEDKNTNLLTMVLHLIKTNIINPNHNYKCPIQDKNTQNYIKEVVPYFVNEFLKG